MSGYTRFGCLIWEWSRLNQLPIPTRYLWLALYTSPPAKRGVPALWHGSIGTMAEAARMPIDETARGLDNLLDSDLAEYDRKHAVLRLTELPDAGEWPSNHYILASWYKRFLMVPECGVRDAHVSTLRWMLERGALEASKNRQGKPSSKHEEVWNDTFGVIAVPVARRRGSRGLAEAYDTSTDAQPSLFRASPSGSYPQAESDSVDSGELNKIIVRETLSRGCGEGEGEGEGATSDSSSSLQGGSGGYPQPPSPPPVARPALRLVPEVLPFQADDLHAVLKATGARWPWMLAPDDRLALERAIGTIGEVGDAPALLALLREYIASGAMGGITPKDIGAPGRFEHELQQALEWRRDSAAKSAALREVYGDLPPR